MKAMILAAGLGTRLQPITHTLPKALVPVNGRPLLSIVLERLKTAGFDDLVINVHHFAEQIAAFLTQHDHFGLTIRLSYERKQVLGTGGGIKQAAPWLNTGEPFLVHNVDVLTDLDLKHFYHTHLRSDALATLAVRHRQTQRYLLFDQNNKLCGWQHFGTGEVRCAQGDLSQATPLAFSGIQVVNPAIFEEMPAERNQFSITDVYLAAATRHNILAFPHDDTFWMDVGKQEQLHQACAMMKERQNVITR